MNKYIKIFEEILSFRLVRAGRVGLLFEEIHLRKFFKEYKVDCVFDVGANSGQYATMLRQRVGYTGYIISFEPIPAAANTLRKKAKRDPKWFVEEVALDKITGTAIFNIMKSDQFSSLHAPSENEVNLFKNQNEIKSQISVKTMTLKEAFKKHKNELHFSCPFLKMDTQGHDLDVARGAEEILKSFVGLQSELSIKRIYENSPDYTEVISYYQSQDFELSAFVPNNAGHFPKLIEIDCIMYNKNIILPTTYFS